MTNKALQITILPFLILFLCNSAASAQSKLNLDSIHTITHTTYNYQNDKAALATLKKSEYDTNSILIRQERFNYIPVDTGFAPSTHYLFTYNPKSRWGSYYNESLPHSSLPNKKYSKQETEFKSYDHDHKRELVKQYKPDSKDLLRKIETKFDANGNPTSTETTSYESSTPHHSIEKVQRNAAGNIVLWESFDDDGDVKMQARGFVAEYKNDTLLLSSSGYLYHNWNEVVNTYDKNNVLTKSISNIGTRQTTGKIQKNDQVTVTYANGKPSKSVDKRGKSVYKTILYTYEENKEILQVTTPEKSYQDIKTYKYLDADKRFLTDYTETLEGKPFLVKNMVYDTTNATIRLTQYTEIEYRENGKDWKTVKEYNERGNLTSVRFFIANVLNREDVYEYGYKS